MQILKGHTSPETAYVVEDYPYGFALRCKIRYWLETTKHGTRLVSQTTNPKRDGEVWNRPKASTYASIAGCMYLDRRGRVQWEQLTGYFSARESEQWLEIYREGLCPFSLSKAMNWIKYRKAHEARRDAARKEVGNV